MQTVVVEESPGPSLSDPDPNWPEQFEIIATPLRAALAEIDAEVEHVGSTSVTGLAAKAVIDMDVVITNASDLPVVVQRLESLGYREQGTRGIPGRVAFDQPSGLPTHYLYVVEKGSKPHLDHVLFRDLLRRRPELRARYEAVKREHSHLLPENRIRYTDAKSDVVAELLAVARQEAGLSDPSLQLHDGVSYRWRESTRDDEVESLHASAFGEAQGSYRWRRVRPLSLGWVTARIDACLVGFVNVAWDGACHAFLLDVVVAPDQRRRGIGTQLVARAIDEVRRADCDWIHVDFEADLAPFYERCGFVSSSAGVLRLGPESLS